METSWVRKQTFGELFLQNQIEGLFLVYVKYPPESAS